MKKRRDQGFTLIEVVVALAILGIGLTAIIELFSGGLRLARTSAEFTKAVSYARIKMEEVSLKPSVEEGTEEGEFDATYGWQVDVKKVDILPVERETEFKPPVDFFKIKITVRWKSGSVIRTTSLESYKTLKPEEQDKKGKTALLDLRISG